MVYKYKCLYINLTSLPGDLCALQDTQEPGIQCPQEGTLFLKLPIETSVFITT